MKFNVAISVLASTTTVVAASFEKDVGEALSSIGRNLAVSKEDEPDVASFLKGRRSNKKNGNVIRNIKKKVQSSKKRNLEGEDLDFSADFDIGLFGRSLQTNTTEPDEEKSVIDSLIDICEAEPTEDFSCVCSDIDAEMYTASVSCTYSQNCIDPISNVCGDNVTFCFVETYNLDVTGPGTGSSSLCYSVTAPETFEYCYGLNYAVSGGDPSGCFFELDGDQCNSCQLKEEDGDSCTVFDCSNIDDVFGTGTLCGDDTLVAYKIEDYQYYGALPCEGGCNICPQNGTMNDIYNTVEIVGAGISYYCWELNRAGLSGYLSGLEEDWCTTLNPIVAGPCDCSSPPSFMTDTPVEAPSSSPEAPTSPPPPSGASGNAHIGGISVAVATVVGVLSWEMI